jgi:hypothetical protein
LGNVKRGEEEFPHAPHNPSIPKVNPKTKHHGPQDYFLLELYCREVAKNKQ